MSDAIARGLALEACHAAPVGAKLTRVPVSDGTTDYTVRRGDMQVTVSSRDWKDDEGADLYLYTISVRRVDDLYGGLVWEPFTSGAGDADTVREALLTWARAL